MTRTGFAAGSGRRGLHGATLASGFRVYALTTRTWAGFGVYGYRVSGAPRRPLTALTFNGSAVHYALDASFQGIETARS